MLRNLLSKILDIRNLPKFFVVILAVTIICLLFPRQELSQKFIYQAGQQWAYPDLIASEAFVAQLLNNDTNFRDSIIGSEIHYKAGNTIVSNGQHITLSLEHIIDQYVDILPPAGFFSSAIGISYFLGYFILTALILGALIFYALKYFSHEFNNVKGISFIVFWPLVFSVIVYFVTNASNLSLYIIPFCIAPIVILNFYDGKLALIIHIVIILIASFISHQGYEFIFLQILVGIITVLIVDETRSWNKFFISIFIIFVTYIFGHLGLALINSGSIVKGEYSTFVWLAINVILLLMAYPFIPIIGKLFELTSNISLAELADMNMPLLKELSLKAPGTLQHSMQVGNLAEAAAIKIGANGLLIKVGALYHDIGKIHNSQYFIENSKGENLHNELSNFESAKIIIDHIAQGEFLAKKANLPNVIIDFIKTHHGTTRVEYFYKNQKNQDPGKALDETLFRYSGPKPRTKEQTILMLADSLEAACKTLKAPTGQDIDNIVDQIITFKIDQNQLNESLLSFQELEECTKVFKSLLRSIHHVRIEYPS